MRCVRVPRAGSLVLWLRHRWKTAFIKRLLVFMRIFRTIVSWRTRKKWGQGNYVSVRGSKLLGLKKGKKRLKSSGFLFICISFSETSKYGSWLQIPYSGSESFVYVAETTMRAYSTTVLPTINITGKWRQCQVCFRIERKKREKYNTIYSGVYVQCPTQ